MPENEQIHHVRLSPGYTGIGRVERKGFLTKEVDDQGVFHVRLLQLERSSETAGPQVTS